MLKKRISCALMSLLLALPSITTGSATVEGNKTNYAADKPTLTSSIYNVNYAGSAAVDSSLDTRWSATAEDAAPSIEIDLQGTKNINHLVMKEYLDKGEMTSRCSDFIITYWDGSDWRQAFDTNDKSDENFEQVIPTITEADYWEGTGYKDAETHETIFALTEVKFNTVHAQKIKFTAKIASSVTLYEFELYDDDEIIVPPLGEVEGLKAEAKDRSIDISWEEPAAENYKAMFIENVTEGTTYQIPKGTNTLSVGGVYTQTYNFIVKTMDTTGKLSAGVECSAIPKDGYINTSEVNIMKELYISPNGADTNTGTKSSPLQSIQKAQELVRGSNKNMTGNIVVYLREGTYYLTETIQLNKADSGSNGYNIIYRNYENEKVTISGGKVLRNWTLKDATKGIYKTTVPEGFDTRQLYVNGQRAQRARGNVAGVTVNRSQKRYETSNAEMLQWKTLKGVEIVSKDSWKSHRMPVDKMYKDPANNNNYIIQLTEPAATNAFTTSLYALPANPLWIENAYELLDEAHEWYLDKEANELYYKPEQGTDLNADEIIAGSVETLLQGEGEKAEPLANIQWKGITFSHNTWLKPNTSFGYPDGQSGAVNAENDWWGNLLSPAGVIFTFSKDVVIEHCVFEHMGNAGVSFGEGSHNNTISNTIFTDLSGNGIQLDGIGLDNCKVKDEGTAVDSNTIDNNIIHNIGVEFMGNVGIFVGFAKNTSVLHNTLYNLPYTGITVGWGWGYYDDLVNFDVTPKNNVIAYNRIYDYMNVLKDGGGIYTLGKQTNSYIHDNYISKQGEDYGHIYLDNGTRNYTVENNVIDGTKSRNSTHCSIFVTGGYPYLYHNTFDNKVLKNYFTDNLQIDNRSSSNTVANNVKVAKGEWDANALSIIKNAGVGGEDGTYEVGKEEQPAEPKLAEGALVQFEMNKDSIIKDDATGTVTGWKDGSSNSFDALVPSGKTSPTYTKNDTNQEVLRFDKDTDRLEVALPAKAMHQFTISFMIDAKDTADTYAQGIGANEGWGSFAFALGKNNTVYTGVKNTSDNDIIVAENAAVKNKMANYAITFANGTTTLYIDGKLIKQTHTNNLSDNPWNTFYIGGANDKMRADLRSLVIYEKSLNQQEIRNMNAYFKESLANSEILKPNLQVVSNEHGVDFNDTTFQSKISTVLMIKGDNVDMEIPMNMGAYHIDGLAANKEYKAQVKHIAGEDEVLSSQVSFTTTVVKETTDQIDKDQLSLYLGANNLETKDKKVAVWKDQSGNGFDARQTIVDKQPDVKVNAVSKKAIPLFDGLMDYVRVDQIGYTGGDFTISYDVKPYSLKNYTNAIAADRGWGSFCLHGAANGTIYAGTSTNSRIVTAQGAMKANQWNHLVYTFTKTGNTGTAILYNNGVEIGRLANMTAPASMTLFSLGKDFSDLNSSIDGEVESLMFYNKALTKEAVDALGSYTQGGREMFEGYPTIKENNLVVAQKNGKINISWNDNYQGTTYQLDVKDADGKLLESYDSAVNSVLINMLKSGTYQVDITATNDAGTATMRNHEIVIDKDLPDMDALQSYIKNMAPLKEASDYSAKSYEIYETAYNAVISLLDDLDLTTVIIETTIEAYENSISNLVNIVKLQSVLTKAEELIKQEEVFTTAYTTTLKEMIQEAKGLLVSSIIQNDVDVMVTDLKNSVDHPVYREDTTITKGILANAISKAQKAMDDGSLDTLAPAVKTLFMRYFTIAGNVYANKDATNGEVMGAWINLADIMQYLDFEADKAALNILITECETINLDDYTIGVEEFKAALANAKKVSSDDNALQARIDAAYGALFSAKEGLGKQDVSKDVLKQFMDLANKVKANSEKYKQDTNWTAMIEALNEAEIVFANDKATQSEVNVAVMKLSESYVNIRLLPNEQMLEELHKFITTAKAVNRESYSKKDYAKIQSVMLEAEKMYNEKDFTEAAFQAMLGKINEAYKVIDEGKITKPGDSTISGVKADGVNTGDITNVALLILIVGLAGTMVVFTRRRIGKE